MAELVEDEFGAGVVQVDRPLPEENAGLAYMADVDAKGEADEDRTWNDLLGKAPTEEADDQFTAKMSPELAAEIGAGQPDPSRDGVTTQDEADANRKSLGQKLGAVASDIGRGLVEAPRQIVGGAADAFDEAGQLLGEITGIGGVQLKNDKGEWDFDYLNWEEWEAAGKQDALTGLFKTGEADSVTGNFVRATSQFMVGFIPALKATKWIGGAGKLATKWVGGAGKLATGARALTAGAVADAVVFDPHEDRLSTFLNEVPALEPFVSDYLADNNPETESSWEGRIKNAIEGAGLGLTAEGATALFRAFKYYKVQRAEAAQLAADQPSVQAQAGRDAMREAARNDIVQDIPDAALAPLGRADGPMLLELSPDAGDTTKIEAYLRTIEAENRVAASVERNDALARIIAVTDAAQVRMGSDTSDDAFGVLLDAVRRGDAPSVGGAKPVAGIIKGLGGVDPSSGFAAELRNLGVTSRTHPGLFRRGGLESLDNVPVNEQPIFSARDLDDGNGYVPEQAWLDAMKDEVAGDPWRSLDEQARYVDEVQPIEELQEELQRLGIDPSEMSNATIRQRIAAITEEQEQLAREFAPEDATTADLDDVLDDAYDRELAEAAASADQGPIGGELPEGIPVNELIEETRRRKLGREKVVAKLAESDEPVRMKRGGFSALVSPSPDAPGGWRITTIGEDGKPSGHIDHGTKAEALDDAFQQGFDVPGRIAKAQPKGQPKIFINHARINSPEDVKAVLQEMADMDTDAIADKTRGVVSNDKTIKESSQEYRDLNDLIGRPPGPMSAAQAVAARRLLVSSGEQIVELAKKASAPDASPADLFNFRRSMAVHYSIQSEVIAARTETARALQSWNIPAGSSPARSKAITDLIMQHGGAGDTVSRAKAVASIGDNPVMLNSMARELGSGKFGRALYQVWINSILSSPITHAVNLLSNAMVAAYSIPERYLAAGVSKAFYNGEIQAAETSAQMFGMVKGMRDGLRLIWHGNNAEGMEGIGDVFDAFGKAEIHVSDISAEAFGMGSEGAFGRGLDMLGKIVNVPGSLLQIEDKFFKSMGYRMELNALAYRTAASEGLEGEDAAKRIADILANPPENLKADALDAAHYMTFTNELGKIGKKFTTGVNAIPAARLVLPFIRTPTNIIKYTFARTPLAYMSGAIRSDIAKGGAAAAQAHARVALGSTLMLVTADMTLEGTITGRGPSDNRLRATKMMTGWLPYSIKVDDRWYQYSRIDPIGMMMGIGADIAELTSNANGEESEMMVTAAVLALANNLASKTYMTGIYDFIGAIDPSNPTNTPGKYLSGFAGSMVPYSSFLRNVARAGDTTMRETRGSTYGEDGKVDTVATYLDNMINNVRRSIPGMGADLPPRRDLFGEPIERASGLGWIYDLLSPIASRADNPDPVTKVILDNKIKISVVPRVIKGVWLSDEQYSEFSRLSGEPLKEHLDKLVTYPGFKRLSDGPDGMKAEVVRGLVNTFRNRAKEVMMREYPELQRLSYMRQLERAQILQGEQN